MTELKLHDYQESGADFIVKKRSAFLMWDMGLGKTAATLTARARLNMPALVFAPLRPLYSTWPAEIRKWVPGTKYTILHGPNKNPRLRNNSDIYLINYEGLKWFYNACCNGSFNLKKFMFIFDESSMMKDHRTKRFEMLNIMYPIFSPYRVCLSATPAPNGLHNLWTQLFLLDRGRRLGKSYWQFEKKHFIREENSRRILAKPFVERQIYDKIDDITHRLDANDYLKMPDLIYNQIRVKPDAKFTRLYNKLETDFFLELDAGTATARTAMVLSAKLRQAVQGAMYLDMPEHFRGDKPFEVIHTWKAEALKETLETINRNVICPIQYRFELDVIRKVLGRRVPIIYGKTPAHESAGLIAQWNRGKIPLLLCHPRSLSHGLNLQAGGSTIIWYGLPWSLEQYQQLIGRLYRQGQEALAVIVHHIILSGTIDENVFNILKLRDANQSQLLDALRERRLAA